MKIYVVMYNLYSRDDSEIFRVFDSAWKKEEDAKRYCDMENGNEPYNPDVEYLHFYKEVELKKGNVNAVSDAQPK